MSGSLNRCYLISRRMFLHPEKNEKQAIFRAHELDLIYAQSRLLYEIIPNTLHSSFDPKINLGPHVDGIVGCTSAKPVDLVTKQVSQLPINQSTSGQATTSSQPTQMVNVLSMQSSDQKGNQQLGRNRKKGKNNRKGGNKKENAHFYDKNARNAGGTSILNVRLSFLANCVRMTTSLTCALIWKMPRDS